MFPKLLMSVLKLLCPIMSMNKGQQNVQTDIQTNPDIVLLFCCFTTVCSCVLWVVVNPSTALSFHKFPSGLREGGALRGFESLLLILIMSEYVCINVHRKCTVTFEMLCLSS